ncbi:unnamed protein product [Ceratitis capitata]|uniref:(Mediterranean fruit fly) hypothetical protein n=1 Tax=Ceratitis capitata TaxID=7213 RepID=A0A811UJX7_CERCA|nr:unnamed protein product [Ceratitis capitata]
MISATIMTTLVNCVRNVVTTSGEYYRRMAPVSSSKASFAIKLINQPNNQAAATARGKTSDKTEKVNGVLSECACGGD